MFIAFAAARVRLLPAPTDAHASAPADPCPCPPPLRPRVSLCVQEGFDPADESAEESKPFKPRGPREYKPRAPQRCMLCTKARGVDVYKAGHECPLK